MNRRDAAIISADIRENRNRSETCRKFGQVKRSEMYAGRAELLRKLIDAVPKGCHGCAYEHAQNGRCVDCARVSNRTDNFRSKFV